MKIMIGGILGLMFAYFAWSWVTLDLNWLIHRYHSWSEFMRFGFALVQIYMFGLGAVLYHAIFWE